MRKKKHGQNKSKRKSLLTRLIRSVVAVVLLSTLILGITLFIKKVADLDTSNFPGPIRSFLSDKNIKVDNKEVGFLLGDFAKKLTDKNIGGDLISGTLGRVVDSISGSSQGEKRSTLFKVCIFSDFHEDKVNLLKALGKIENLGCGRLFVLGDLTNFGDIKTLKEIKAELDKSGLEYFVIPGDHDIAQSVGPENFIKVFGKDYQAVEYIGINFLLIDNSANFTVIDPRQMAWIENNIGNTDFILLSQPLFTNGLNLPFNTIFMGSTRTPPESSDLKEKQQAVADQGRGLLDLIRRAESVKAVVSGEHHISSELVDSARASLKHYVVGAVTSVVNEYPQSIIQSSRFSVLTVYEDGSYSMEDVLVE